MLVKKSSGYICLNVGFHACTMLKKKNYLNIMHLLNSIGWGQALEYNLYGADIIP